MLRKYFPVLLFLCCYTELSFNFCFEVSFIFLTSFFEKKNFNVCGALSSPSSYPLPPFSFKSGGKEWIRTQVSTEG